MTACIHRAERLREQAMRVDRSLAQEPARLRQERHGGDAVGPRHHAEFSWSSWRYQLFSSACSSLDGFRAFATKALFEDQDGNTLIFTTATRPHPLRSWLDEVEEEP